MPAKRKEEVREDTRGTFTFADGSIFNGQYAPRSILVAEAAAAAAANATGAAAKRNLGMHGGSGSGRQGAVGAGGGVGSPLGAGTAHGGVGFVDATAGSSGAGGGPFSPAVGLAASAAAVDPLLQHGQGTYKDCAGAQYEGQWREGGPSGEGILMLPKGTNYVGAFHNGKYGGFGRYTWADGSYYEGQWEDGTMHGTGVYVDVQGRRWHGVFAHGQSTSLEMEVEL